MASEGKNFVNKLRVQTESYHLKWEFTGFDEIPFLADHPILSPSFVLGNRSEGVWQLLMAKEMRTKRTKSTNLEKKRSSLQSDCSSHVDEVVSVKPKEKALGFKLVKTEDYSTWDVAKYHVEVKTGDICLKTTERTENGSSDYETSSFAYIYESDLEGKDLYGAKTISIETFIQYKYIDLRPLDPVDAIDARPFVEDLSSLLKSGKHTDVILKSTSSEILAHKSILCARGYGFDCHLQDDPESMKEKLDLDLEESVAEAMLAYIYCGGLPLEFTLEKVPALCAAAEKYKVNGLKAAIFEHLKKNLGPDFCLECLEGSGPELKAELFLGLDQDKIKSVLVKDKCAHKICQ